jgi:cytoskeletal protein RodZ
MSSSFVRKKIESASSLGEKLKQARGEAKVTLEELAQATQIPKNYLLSLEEGRYNLLPADVYVRGYLKAYLKCLSLDYSEMLALYKKERGIEEHIKKSKLKIKKSKINFVITPKMIKFGGIAILVLGLFFYLWTQLHNLAAPPKLEVFEPASDLTTKDDTITIKGKTEPEVELFINDQPVSIDSQGNFEKSIGLSQGMNTLNIRAKSKLGKEKMITRKILVEITQNQASQELQPTKQGCDLELELKITIKEESTWLHVLEDDQVGFSGVAQADFSQTFHAKEKIIVSSGKANTIFVEFCGKDLGALGQKGEVIKNKEFTKDLL